MQGSYQLTPKLKLGLSGGISRNRTDLVSAGDFKSNTNVTAGLYYALTKSVTLDVELSQTRSKDFLGNSEHMNGFAAGRATRDGMEVDGVMRKTDRPSSRASRRRRRCESARRG